MTVWQEAGDAGIHIIRASGRLDHRQNASLEETLLALLAQGKVRLVVDLAGAEYMNSAGLRILLSSWRVARQHQGNLVLCGLSDRLQELFHMVGFDQVFQIYGTEAEARTALKDGPDHAVAD